MPKLGPEAFAKRRVARAKRKAPTQKERGRKEAIVAFLKQRALAGNHVPPTYREIAAATGISSTSMVSRYLKRLEAMGEVEVEAWKARTVHLAALPVVPLPEEPGESELDFVKTREALLGYWLRVGEQGYYEHWRLRCLGWDEIPELVSRVIAHAVAHMEKRG